MKRKKLIVCVTASFVAVALLCLYLWHMFFVTDRDMLRSVVVVEHATWNEITVDGRPMLYFSVAPGDTAILGLTARRDSARHRRLAAGCWLNRYAAVPSCGGRVVTVYKDSTEVSHVAADSAVALCRRAVSVQMKTLGMQKAELAYYMRVHGVQDAGYQDIAALASKVAAAYGDVERVARIVDSVTDSGRHRISIRHRSQYTAIYHAADGGIRRLPLHVVHSVKNNAVMVLQTADGHTPDGVRALSEWPWRPGGKCVVSGVGFPGLGEEGIECDTVSPVATRGHMLHGTRHDLPPLLASDGSPVFTAHGRFVGIVCGNSIARVGCGQHARHNGKDSLDGVKGKTMVYRGTMKNGRYDGYGTLAVGDSVLYAGQWRGGQRWGRGVSHDSLHHRIVGTWRADTLVSGTWTDSTGTYSGELNRDAIANGRGSFVDRRSDLYYGMWRDGERTGFGFALTRGKHMRVGEWRKDRYLGERLEYTPDRIYGIDISRFQHDVGRKRYTIDWSKVRISHLGTISKKNVTGKVDYPVSFCYVKSTEGTTLRNRYYAADCRAARAHGIRVGAYHFFSTRTPAAQQARFFIRNSSFCKGDLPPVLDVEPSHEQISKMGGPAALFSAVRTWMRIVGEHTGTRPVLYISQTFVNRYLPLAPDLKRDYNIWIARYGEYKPDVHLVYWQLCPDGSVRGIRPKVDINVFNGYRSEYEDFLRRECVR